MECHDVRSLLTFIQRGCEHLDATEREVLQAHLDKCPDCAGLTQAERRLDETLGQIMRDVPVPAGLQANVLKRLADERRPSSWRRSALAAAAAAAVLLAVGAGVWYANAVPEVSVDDVNKVAADELEVFRICRADDPALAADKYFEAAGVYVLAPRDFDYRFLHRVEIVEFKKRRVAKLSFRGEQARADVIILPHDQFHTETLADHRDQTILIQRERDFTYLIFHSNGLETLRGIRA